MKHTWTEFTCDFCNNAEHFLVDRAKRGYTRASAEKQARDSGWIITTNNNHFCSKDCYNKFKKGYNDTETINGLF